MNLPVVLDIEENKCNHKLSTTVAIGTIKDRLRDIYLLFQAKSAIGYGQIVELL